MSQPKGKQPQGHADKDQDKPSIRPPVRSIAGWSPDQKLRDAIETATHIGPETGDSKNYQR